MIEDLQKHIDKIMNEQNNRGLPEFEGYSPIEMQYILYDTFGDCCPIKLQKLTDSEYKTIPILNLIIYLASIIAKNGELKLTDKGFLPIKIVADIYNQGFIKDEYIESGILKLNKETTSTPISLARILLEISGITKKKNNKLSITKSGGKVIVDKYKLLHLIFMTFGSKFNWAYFDGYGQNNIGQLGYGFSLILVSKFGNEKRLNNFYSDKYFKAFPQLLNNSNIIPTYETIENYSAHCYSLRTFERFLYYFGLIKWESKNEWDAEKFITKTDLFDKLIQRLSHERISYPANRN